MKAEPLPNDEQRRGLGMLLHEAFNFLRYADTNESQALAYALHNIPAEMYGWGLWSMSATRGRLVRFQTEHYREPNAGPDFVAMIRRYFPAEQFKLTGNRVLVLRGLGAAQDVEAEFG